MKFEHSKKFKQSIFFLSVLNEFYKKIDSDEYAWALLVHIPKPSPN
jgi:hypothetical protein